MIKFEKVPRFKDIDLAMPERKTFGAAGYDFAVAEDVIIPPYNSLYTEMMAQAIVDKQPIINYTLEDMAALTKRTKAKPALVSTGMCCHLDEGYYLELTVRSSCPLKHWLILANGQGVIDSDYVLADNNGEIFFQLINLSPWPIQLKRGDIIGQGIIHKYYTTDDDNCTGTTRTGGFGSTSDNKMTNAIDSGLSVIQQKNTNIDRNKILEAINKELHKGIYLQNGI